MIKKSLKNTKERQSLSKIRLFFKYLFNVIFWLYIGISVIGIVWGDYTIYIGIFLLSIFMLIWTILGVLFKVLRKKTILVPLGIGCLLFAVEYSINFKEQFTRNPKKQEMGDVFNSTVSSLSSSVSGMLNNIIDSESNTTTNEHWGGTEEYYQDTMSDGNSWRDILSGGSTEAGDTWSDPLSGGNTLASISDTFIYNTSVVDNNKYDHISESGVKLVSKEPVSTFSIDVDTSSYANVRSYLDMNQLPPKDAVRIEELINYFPYNYELPAQKTEPFAIHATLTQSPWKKGNQLLHIGIKGYEDKTDTDKPLNLVLLIDTSGSMMGSDRLELLKNGFNMLVDKMTEKDTISIVTYAGSSAVLLQPTSGQEKSKIKSAIQSLSASGGTYGEGGLKKAYELAKINYNKDAVNRILLGTDGDFNIGMTRNESLTDYVSRQSKEGIYLSILNVGRGNYNDSLMQSLAQNGNGIGYYLDSIVEAKRVLSDDIKKTLFPIANDVKIQVEFNPAKVAEYRLIGYETRMLNKEDFNNDKVDAGDINAGHSVTAIYELTPVGSENKMVDDLRYEQPEMALIQHGNSVSDEVAFVKVRYKLPDDRKSRLITQPVVQEVVLNETSDDVRFSIAVAGFAQVLKDSNYVEWDIRDIRSFAKNALGEDAFDYRLDFLSLMKKAEALLLSETVTHSK